MQIIGNNTIKNKLQKLNFPLCLLGYICQAADWLYYYLYKVWTSNQI